ncbi:hypothetical protein [Aquaspirillum soli]
MPTSSSVSQPGVDIGMPTFKLQDNKPVLTSIPGKNTTDAAVFEPLADKQAYGIGSDTTNKIYWGYYRGGEYITSAAAGNAGNYHYIIAEKVLPVATFTAANTDSNIRGLGVRAFQVNPASIVFTKTDSTQFSIENSSKIYVDFSSPLFTVASGINLSFNGESRKVSFSSSLQDLYGSGWDAPYNIEFPDSVFADFNIKGSMVTGGSSPDALALSFKFSATPSFEAYGTFSFNRQSDSYYVYDLDKTKNSQTSLPFPSDDLWGNTSKIKEAGEIMLGGVDGQKYKIAWGYYDAGDLMQNSSYGLSLIDSRNHFITSNLVFLGADNILPASGERSYFLRAGGKLYQDGVWKSQISPDSWLSINYDSQQISGAISVDNAPSVTGYAGTFSFAGVSLTDISNDYPTVSMSYSGSDFSASGHSIYAGKIGDPDAGTTEIDGLATMLKLSHGSENSLYGSGLFYRLPDPYKNAVLELDKPDYKIRFDDIEGSKRYYATKEDTPLLHAIPASYRSTTVVSGSGTDTITHNISWGIWEGSSLGYTTDSSRVSGWTDLSDNLYVINTTLPLTTNLPTAGSATYSLMPLVSSLDSGDLTGGTITANFTTQKVSADLSFSMAGIDYKLINADQSLANLQKNSGVPLDVSLAPSATGVSEFLNKGNIKGRFLGVDAQVLATKIELRKTDEVTKVQGIAIFNK